MADDTTDTSPKLSFDSIKSQINELRQARKLKTIRLNAGLKYVSTKLQQESEHRTEIHEKIMNHIEIAKTDLEKEKTLHQ